MITKAKYFSKIIQILNSTESDMKFWVSEQCHSFLMTMQYNKRPHISAQCK